MPFTLSPKKVNCLYLKLSKSVPNPRSELRYNNHFELLIAVILSAQSTDKVVNEITPCHRGTGDPPYNPKLLTILFNDGT